MRLHQTAFCPDCGKRNGFSPSIHTCTPPLETPKSLSSAADTLAMLDQSTGTGPVLVAWEDSDGVTVFSAVPRQQLAGALVLQKSIAEDFVPRHDQERQAGQKRAAGAVMMSAHALCPTDMSHPRRMAWVAEHFLQNYTAPQPAQAPDGWIEIRLPQDGQTIEGKSAIDAPAWIEDYDAREQLSNMRFWRPAPDRPR